MQHNKRAHLSLIQIGLAVLLISSAWFIFWSPLFTAFNVIVALAFSIIVLLVLALVNRLRPEWRIETTRPKRVILWGGALALSVASPLLLNWWVIQSANMVIRDMGISAQPIEHEVRLVDRFSLIDSPARRIVARYQVEESNEIAVDKISEWAAQQNPQWLTSYNVGLIIDDVPADLYAGCDPGSPITASGIHYVLVGSDSRLDLMIRFFTAPQACGLPSNPFNYWFYTGY